jgi:hypothetical protein
VGLAAAGGAVTSFVALAFRRASGRGGESGATLVSALPSSKQVIREVNASLPIDRCLLLVAGCCCCSRLPAAAPSCSHPLELCHCSPTPHSLSTVSAKSSRGARRAAVQLHQSNPPHLTSPHRREPTHNVIPTALASLCMRRLAQPYRHHRRHHRRHQPQHTQTRPWRPQPLPPSMASLSPL